MDPLSQFTNPQPDPTLLEVALYAVLIFIGVFFMMTVMAVLSLVVFAFGMFCVWAGLRLFNNLPDPIGKTSKIFGLVFRNLWRNWLRTSLTYIALFVLTGMLTLILSIVATIQKITDEKEGSVQVIMTERFSIPSMMPRGYANQLKQIIMNDLPPESRPKNIDDDFMTWSFVGGSLDLEKRTKENSVFALAMEPNTILTMLDIQGMNREELGDDAFAELQTAVAKMKEDKRNCIVGQEQLAIMNKKVGETFKIYALGYKGVEFELKIVASFPAASRWGKNTVMHLDYFNDTIDKANLKRPDGSELRTVNLVWVRLPDKLAYERLATIVNDPKSFSNPQAKLETASAGISTFLDAFRDILWGMKYLIMPAIVVIMCLVIGITITIGVRERRPEMAVMKVLGFQPWQIVMMIVGEAVLIGLFGGMLSTWLVWWIPVGLEWLKTAGGVKIQIAFFNSFKPPIHILWLGPLLGIFVGFIGSALPAWSSRKVKVSEVFAQVS